MGVIEEERAEGGVKPAGLTSQVRNPETSPCANPSSQKGKGPRMARTCFRKKIKGGGLTVLGFKIYDNATVTETAWS